MKTRGNEIKKNPEDLFRETIQLKDKFQFDGTSVRDQVKVVCIVEGSLVMVIIIAGVLVQEILAVLCFDRNYVAEIREKTGFLLDSSRVHSQNEDVEHPNPDHSCR